MICACLVPCFLEDKCLKLSTLVKSLLCLKIRFKDLFNQKCILTSPVAQLVSRWTNDL